MGGLIDRIRHPVVVASRVKTRQKAGPLYTHTVNTTVSNLRANAPALANCAEGFCNGAGIVRFTRDGTAPTTSKGGVAYQDEYILLDSRDEIERFQAYSPTSATIDWEWFTDLAD